MSARKELERALGEWRTHHDRIAGDNLALASEMFLAHRMHEPPEPEWEYASALRAADGTIWDEEIGTAEEAWHHVRTCDGTSHDDECIVVRRTPERLPGPWEPVPASDGDSDA